jgi:hypothetical protein
MSGIVAITAGLVQYFRRAKFNPLAWVAIGICCLFIACYQAWLDENTLRTTAECQVRRLHSTRDERREFIKNNLAPFFTKAHQFLDRGTGINPNDSAQLIIEIRNFYSDVVDWIKNNMGDLAVAKLKDTNGPVYDFVPRDNVELYYWLNALNKISNNLTVLIQQIEWDKFTPDVPNDCH